MSTKTLPHFDLTKSQDQCDNWKNWINEFMQCAPPNFELMPNTYKISFLLKKMGSDAEYILRYCLDISVDEIYSKNCQLTFEDLLDQLDDYFLIPNATFALLNRRQRVDESLDEFSIAMIFLSYACYFGPDHDTWLRLVFIANLHERYEHVKKYALRLGSVAMPELVCAIEAKVSSAGRYKNLSRDNADQRVHVAHVELERSSCQKLEVCELQAQGTLRNVENLNPDTKVPKTLDVIPKSDGFYCSSTSVRGNSLSYLPAAAEIKGQFPSEVPEEFNRPSKEQPRPPQPKDSEYKTTGVGNRLLKYHREPRPAEKKPETAQPNLAPKFAKVLDLNKGLQASRRDILGTPLTPLNDSADVRTLETPERDLETSTNVKNPYGVLSCPNNNVDPEDTAGELEGSILKTLRSDIRQAKHNSKTVTFSSSDDVCLVDPSGKEVKRSNTAQECFEEMRRHGKDSTSHCESPLTRFRRALGNLTDSRVLDPGSDVKSSGSRPSNDRDESTEFPLIEKTFSTGDPPSKLSSKVFTTVNQTLPNDPVPPPLDFQDQEEENCYLVSQTHSDYSIISVEDGSNYEDGCSKTDGSVRTSVFSSSHAQSEENRRFRSCLSKSADLVPESCISDIDCYVSPPPLPDIAITSITPAVVPNVEKIIYNFQEVEVVHVSSKDSAVSVCFTQFLTVFKAMEDKLEYFNQNGQLGAPQTVQIGSRYAILYHSKWRRVELLSEQNEFSFVSLIDYGIPGYVSTKNLKTVPESVRDLEPLSFRIVLPFDGPSVRRGTRLWVRKVQPLRDGSWMVECK